MVRKRKRVTNYDMNWEENEQPSSLKNTGGPYQEAVESGIMGMGRIQNMSLSEHDQTEEKCERFW